MQSACTSRVAVWFLALAAVLTVGCVTTDTPARLSAAPARTMQHEAIDFLELGRPMMEKMRLALVQHQRGEWDEALATYQSARRKARVLEITGGPERGRVIAALDELQSEIYYGKAYVVSQNPRSSAEQKRQALRWLEHAMLRNPEHRTAYLLWEELQAWR